MARSDPLDTPVMRQYLDMKSRYPDCILFFRMGDFYEMFLEDAKTAAPIMDIALTRRQSEVPMAGVPYHSVDTYLARLVGAGLRVAIAEQKQDPSNPKLMQREVVRILSPGTLLEEGLLSGGNANYLMALAFDGDTCGIALADISTGDFFCYESKVSESSDGMGPADFIARYQPGEILIASNQSNQMPFLRDEMRRRIRPLESYKASPSEGIRQIEARFGAKIEGLGFRKQSVAAGAVSLILHYVFESFPERPPYLNAPVLKAPEAESLILDEKTIRNLELVANPNSGSTLLSVIDKTRSAPGKRALRNRLLSPFRSIELIYEHQLALTELIESGKIQEIQSELDRVSDLERTISRMTSGKTAPRDFRNLIQTMDAARTLQATMKNLPRTLLVAKVEVEAELLKLCAWMDQNLQEELPALFGNGPLLKDGVDANLDEARKARKEGAQWILDLEASERKRTGLNLLKIKYNRVSGYFLELPKSQASQAPEDYERKQTLVNAERFTFEPLKELERKILSADETITTIESEFLD
ncbi:MAG: DNA mismatch repair protein MutS, partial [Leptospiraceae bacterium]|nr:DNA mismatch repair protein MutS [Leptospiraceae bacterium]